MLLSSLTSRHNFRSPSPHATLQPSLLFHTTEINTAIVFSLTLVVMSCFTHPAHAFTMGGEHPCTYDFQLQTSTMKVTCPGSPSVVNVYADTARLQAEDLRDEIVRAGKDRTVPLEGDGSSPRASHSRDGGWNSHGSSAAGGGRYGAQRDRGYAPPGEDPFATHVYNASRHLDEARRSLTGYSNSLQNITVKMAEGHLNLQQDMDHLMRSTESAEKLKQGIVAAMTNQFNFMRAVLLTRNQELQKLVTSLAVLVDVTKEGMFSALDSHRTTQERVGYLNETLVSVRSMLTSELRKKDKRRRRANKQGKKTRPKDSCPKEISAIGAGTFRAMKYRVGSYMVQSNNPNIYRSIYIMPGSGPQDELQEYDTPQDVAFNIPAHYIPLPYYCSGTGHVVFRRHLYCHQHGTDLIMKFHLKRYDIIADLPLPGAGYSNTFPYSSRENTDVDLAVDEYGLWAIYATNDSAGKVVITKIDHKTMELDKTWMTSYPKRNLGNAFMVCGTLYATDSHRNVPTFIRYVYSTETGQEQLLQPGEMPFLNSAMVGRPNVFAHEQRSGKGGANAESVGDDGRQARAASRADRERRRRRRRGSGASRWQPVRTRPNRAGNPRGERTTSDLVTARESNSVMLSYDFRTSSLLSWNNGRLETFPIYFRVDD